VRGDLTIKKIQRREHGVIQLAGTPALRQARQLAQ